MSTSENQKPQDETQREAVLDCADLLVCPQCGCDTPTLNEGYCEPCRTENQTELDEHNARFDWWEKLSEAEKDTQIKEAY